MCAKKQIYAVITGSGSYIPPVVVKNSDFEDKEFLKRGWFKDRNSGQRDHRKI
jgi:3-oxoacyl-[acyl-carrier-protein] synthase III